MNIHGKIVTLRAPELDDVPLLHRWSNDPEVWNMLGGWHFPFSSRSTDDWVRSRKDGNLTSHVFCIDTPEDGMIGTANLVDIDWKNGNAFHGMMIGEESLRGRGYALDTVLAIMRYAFMELGLQRLDTDIIAYNQRSLGFYLGKCGWKQEGVRRNWYFRNGQHHNKIIVGVTRDDYLELLRTNRYWD